MAQDLMRYEDMAREALRGVVREALRRAADDGLPGAHHFYISFRTQAPGVDLDPDVATKYPDDMTVVLEKQFWDLAVDDDAFEVTLNFNRVPKYLRVPFDAITQFHDPSVGFTLRFDAAGDAVGDGSASENPTGAAAIRTSSSEPAGDGDESGQVVSLDAFRKKTD